MNTVVKQECLRYNKLLAEMVSSIRDLRKALKGLIVMTMDLELAGKAMLINDVPANWMKKGPLSLKPLSSWWLDMLARVSFVQSWVKLEHSPPVYWISGFFFPQAFFTGALQNYARKHTIAIDELDYDFKVFDEIEP